MPPITAASITPFNNILNGFMFIVEFEETSVIRLVISLTLELTVSLAMSNGLSSLYK